jgi:predicted O-methyltransferase YrrM
LYTHKQFVYREGAPGFWIDRPVYDGYRGVAMGVANSFSYMYQYEVLAMMVMVRSLPDKAVVVNIGVGAGTSALAMLEARPDLAPTTYSIDIRDDDNPYGGLLNERNAFAEHMPGILPVQIKGDSSEVGRLWDKGPIDLLFIDADHTTEGVTKDIEAWYSHVTPGGIIIFHDYDHGFWPSVKPVADEHMKNDILLAVVDISAIFMKRPW